MEITHLRQEYHREICQQIAYMDAQGIPNIADRSMQTSSLIAKTLFEHLPCAIEANPELATVFGSDYLIKPDIVIARHPFEDAEINQITQVLSDSDPCARLTPLRSVNQPRPLLHASISCKWTIRSAQTEALNLMHNRKGHTPFIMVVTAEPLPSRLASLTMGTGDLDCTYHFALHELIDATLATNQDRHEMLMTMISGKRLRDISDLPFDLAI
jgi:hypothetical protein